ncbi:unannotated protein [freshwater metagenome]|uniref:Unannotated protein n=1 Tax=freshwater metagenome TaxID=449393 RepID=A0A6J7DDG6_9ZZZZ|nr:hypothetical protein [Actinomycetota bacterium]
MRRRSDADAKPTWLMRHRLARANGDSGAAAVEFALIAPLLIALIFGVIEMSFAFRHSSALNSMTASAAHAAAAKPIPSAKSSGSGLSIINAALTDLARNASTLSAGDYIYIYSADGSGQPDGSTSSNPCPASTCLEYAFDGGNADGTATVSNFHKYSGSWNGSDLQAECGDGVGVYIDSLHNWLSGTSRLLGVGPDLGLEAQQVVTVYPSQTFNPNALCGARKSDKHDRRHHHDSGFGGR